MSNISFRIFTTINKSKALLFRRTYKCICGMHKYVDEFVLSEPQRSVIKEALHNESLTKTQKAYYIVAKCEQAGLSVSECIFLLNIFDFHPIDDFFDMDCDCELCKRINRYSPSVS